MSSWKGIKRVLKHCKRLKIPLFLFDPTSSSDALVPSYILDVKLVNHGWYKSLVIITSIGSEWNDKPAMRYRIPSVGESLVARREVDYESGREYLSIDTDLHSEYTAKFIIRKWEDHLFELSKESTY